MLQNKIDKNNNYIELNNNKQNQNNEKFEGIITKRNHINNQKIRLEENTRFHKDKLKEIEENIKKVLGMHPTQMEKKEFDGDNKNGSETRESRKSY